MERKARFLGVEFIGASARIFFLAVKAREEQVPSVQ
jgi:hypothetical protein